VVPRSRRERDPDVVASKAFPLGFGDADSADNRPGEEMVMAGCQFDQFLFVSHTTLGTRTSADRQSRFMSRSFRGFPGQGMT